MISEPAHHNGAWSITEHLHINSILSKFSVSTVQAFPLRIKDANLASTSRFKAIAARPHRTKAVLIKRDQPGSFPFRLERQALETDSERVDNDGNQDSSKLKIKFVYRTVESELRATLLPHLAAMLSKHKVEPSRRLIEAISTHVVADRATIERLNNDNALDSLGKADFLFAHGEELSTWWSTCQHDLRSYWTNMDEWDRIRAAIVEASQVCIWQESHRCSEGILSHFHPDTYTYRSAGE